MEKLNNNKKIIKKHDILRIWHGETSTDLIAFE